METRCSLVHCAEAELWPFAGFLFVCCNLPYQSFARVSPEVHQSFARVSPEFRQNIALEHLKKGDDHNSAFPHGTGVPGKPAQ